MLAIVFFKLLQNQQFPRDFIALWHEAENLNGSIFADFEVKRKEQEHPFYSAPNIFQQKKNEIEVTIDDDCTYVNMVFRGTDYFFVLYEREVT